MKTGQSLTELATELERQAKSKRDFVASTSQLMMTAEREEAPGVLGMQINGHGEFPLTDTAHEQVASRLQIPQKYYDKMRADGQTTLLRMNVNTWLHKEATPKMVRTLDGKMRAFLSHRYRPLDNFDLAETVLPLLVKNGCKVESSALTEKRLYIKAVTEKLTLEVKKGDVVQAGIVISNSEVGAGSVKIEPLVLRLVCQNGLISNDYSMKKYHVGRSSDAGGDLAEEFFRDETRKTDDKAFWMKVYDVVKGSFDKDIFSRIVDRMKLATEVPITKDPVKVVEIVQERFGLNDGERSGILTHLIKGGDLTQYGLMNAVTRASQDVDSYDRATEIERLGGAVLELPKKEWAEIVMN